MNTICQNNIENNSIIAQDNFLNNNNEPLINLNNNSENNYIGHSSLTSFTYLFNSIPEPILIIKVDSPKQTLELLEVNSAAVQLYGWTSKEEIINEKSIQALFNENDVEKIINYLQDSNNKQVTSSSSPIPKLNIHSIKKDGKSFSCYLTFSPLNKSSGSTITQNTSYIYTVMVHPNEESISSSNSHGHQKKNIYKKNIDDSISSCQTDDSDYIPICVDEIIDLRSRYQKEYDEVERLGKGGFGAVYKAKNRLDGQYYAIKKIKLQSKPSSLRNRINRTTNRNDRNKHLDEDEQIDDNQENLNRVSSNLEYLSAEDKRIVREVKTFARISNHPNIVRYHASWIEVEAKSSQQQHRRHHHSDQEKNNSFDSDDEEDDDEESESDISSSSNDEEEEEEEEENKILSSSSSSSSLLFNNTTTTHNKNGYKKSNSQTHQDEFIISFEDTTTTTKNINNNSIDNYYHENNTDSHESSYYFIDMNALNENTKNGKNSDLHEKSWNDSGDSDFNHDDHSPSSSELSLSSDYMPFKFEKDQKSINNSNISNNTNGPSLSQNYNFNNFNFNNFNQFTPLNKNEKKKKKNVIATTKSLKIDTRATRANNNDNDKKTKTDKHKKMIKKSKLSLYLLIQMELCSGQTLEKWIAKRNQTLAAQQQKHQRRVSTCTTSTTTTTSSSATLANSNPTSGYMGYEKKREMNTNSVDRRQVLKIFKQVVQAIAHVHWNGCIHRDVKPANVFFQDDNHILLGDFGLAKDIELGHSIKDHCSSENFDSSMSSTLSHSSTFTNKKNENSLTNTYTSSSSISQANNTAETQIKESYKEEEDEEEKRRKKALQSYSSSPMELTSGVGTYLYASPEQLASSHGYDNKTDIYSLGILFFELLWPFKTGMERIQTLTNVRNGKFPDTFVEKWPLELPFLRSLLNPDPSQRPTAQDILDSDILNTNFITPLYVNPTNLLSALDLRVTTRGKLEPLLEPNECYLKYGNNNPITAYNCSISPNNRNGYYSSLKSSINDNGYDDDYSISKAGLNKRRTSTHSPTTNISSKMMRSIQYGDCSACKQKDMAINSFRAQFLKTKETISNLQDSNAKITKKMIISTILAFILGSILSFAVLFFYFRNGSSMSSTSINETGSSTNLNNHNQSGAAILNNVDYYPPVQPSLTTTEAFLPTSSVIQYESVVNSNEIPTASAIRYTHSMNAYPTSSNNSVEHEFKSDEKLTPSLNKKKRNNEIENKIENKMENKDINEQNKEKEKIKINKNSEKKIKSKNENENINVNDEKDQKDKKNKPKTLSIQYYFTSKTITITRTRAIKVFSTTIKSTIVDATPTNQ